MVSLAANAQDQIDFRGIISFNLEKKLSKSFSLTFMNEERFTYDFQELGLAFFDTGIKYKLTDNLSMNGNYRFLLVRNLDNFYDSRHMFYGDIDVSKPVGRWTFGGTARFQSYFYSHVSEGYKRPLVYSRDKLEIKYRVNYAVSPFAEFELFVPINHPVRKSVDQVRGTLGLSYTINRYVKIEFYEEIQKLLNRINKDTYIVSAMEWYFRF